MSWTLRHIFLWPLHYSTKMKNQQWIPRPREYNLKLMHREVCFYSHVSVEVETTTVNDRMAPTKQNVIIAARRHRSDCRASHRMSNLIYTELICILPLISQVLQMCINIWTVIRDLFSYTYKMCCMYLYERFDISVRLTRVSNVTQISSVD